MDLSLYEELAIVNRERLYMYLEHASTFFENSARWKGVEFWYWMVHWLKQSKQTKARTLCGPPHRGLHCGSSKELHHEPQAISASINIERGGVYFTHYGVAIAHQIHGNGFCRKSTSLRYCQGSLKRPCILYEGDARHPLVRTMPRFYPVSTPCLCCH